MRRATVALESLTCQLLSAAAAAAAAAGSRVRSEVEADLARISAELGLSSDLARISAELGMRGGVGAAGVDAGETPAYTSSGTYADVS
jgi:hypothetical protein